MSTSHTQFDFTSSPFVPTLTASSEAADTKFDKLVVCDPAVSEQLIEERRARGADLHDEVWEGVYVMSPLAGLEHQFIAFELAHAFRTGMGRTSGSLILVGVNVSDRDENWAHNYRCPDVALFLKDTKATLHEAFTHGGPDFAVEIASPNDNTREKFDFYAKVGTRELLIVDRDPWQLELFRLVDGKLVSVATSTIENSRTLASDVIPFTFKLEAGETRPQILVGHTESDQSWRV